MDTNERIHDFNDFALNMVNIKAAELVGKAGFSADDFEDLRQDLITDLLQRLRNYQHDRSDFKLFVTCVIDRKTQNMIRFRESDKRDYRCEDCSLNEEITTAGSEQPVQRLTTFDQDDQDIRTGKHRRTAQERTQMQLDFQAVLARLSPELRRIAQMLMTKPATTVARELGIPRRTFRQTHLVELREIFTAKGLDLYVS